MTPERWTRVTELFDRACQIPVEARLAWVRGHAEDPALAAEVEAMLASYETDPEYLESPATAGAGLEDAAADTLLGQRLGPYRLTRQVGRGGMGVVYEAERDDDAFDRRVAVKVLPVWRSGTFAERFRFERRVLAGLDHAGIARLLDAGTGAHGLTYLVMEFVDGEPVTAWCDARQSSTRERVALVEGICDAVAYAHQHLVIHRDLKPANILVTDDGRPKLLDFGIAALLADDGASAGTTGTGQHSFTPEFASPEQVRGERVTTATDVYSLGVLLYVLLTGRHPYDLHGRSPLDVIRIVCEVDPPLPSGVAPSDRRAVLRGDLDAVVAKALEKRVEDRYQSVPELLADLRSWRLGHAVSAAPASAASRARRFVLRHRKAALAAAALAVVLAGGALTTAWQARIARIERDRAQNRFRQIQEFSRSLLFDVHEALRNVPGATEARRLLLDRAVTLLDGLAADAVGDDALAFELAQAYQRLAQVQGNQFSENVGDTAGAVASLRKAAGSIDRLHVDEPDDTRRLILAVHIHFDLAAVLSNREDPAAREAAAEHAALLEELEARHPHTPEVLAILAEGYSDTGRLAADREDYQQARHAYEHAVALYDGLTAPERPLAVVRQNAFALKRLGAILMRAGELDASEGRYLAALRLDEELIARDDRPATRYDVTFTLSDLALVHARRGAWDDAEQLWQRALGIRSSAAEADPRNTRALSGVATLYGRLGTVATARHDHASAADRYREEVDARERLLAATGRLPSRVSELSWARLRLAEALLARRAAAPGGAAPTAWAAEARRLVAATTRQDGKVPVPAGSEPDYVELYDTLTAALGRLPR
ncbi:MAG: serine/threonine-protein kinase [Vicinamibacterales bacterium]